MKRYHVLLLVLFAAVWPCQELRGQFAMARAIRPLGGGVVESRLNIKGLHLEGGQQVNVTPTVLTDGGGFRWDLYYGNLQNGTNNVYSGAMNLQVNNNGFAANGLGMLSKDGSEVECGPFMLYGAPNVTVSRRIKAYKDAPLARWLDIFENRSGQDVTLNIMMYSNFGWQCNRVQTSSGKAAWAEDDFALVQEFNANGNRVPSLLHVYCDKRSKIRPKMQMHPNNRYIYVNWSITVPANSAVILCSFESQNNSAKEQIRLMDKFRAGRYLRDLPTAVRKMIVNFFGGSTAIGEIDLDRSESTDKVLLTRGDPILGTIANKSFTLQTLAGEMKFDAQKVIGMAAAGDGESMLMLLADGQVLSGILPQQKLQVTLATGGQLEIPIEKIAQWSFKVTAERPLEPQLAGPMAILRSGDRLYFDPKKTALPFRTRNGRVDLAGSKLLELSLENGGNGVHRATFCNGASLGGMLESETLSFSLPLADKPLVIEREMVHSLRFAAQEDQESPFVTKLLLSNDDVLVGALVDKELKISTEFGVFSLAPANLKSLSVEQGEGLSVVATLWDDSVHRGQLQQTDLAFRIADGPELSVPLCQTAAMVSTAALPPPAIVESVRKLVPQLGDKDFAKREAAGEALLKLGPGIVPLLGESLQDKDPEIRLRVQNLVQKLGAAKTVNPANPIAPKFFGG